MSMISRDIDQAKCSPLAYNNIGGVRAADEIVEALAHLSQHLVAISVAYALFSMFRGLEAFLVRLLDAFDRSSPRMVVR